MKRIIALTITVIILAACTKRESNSGITILPDVELNNFVRSGVLLTSLIDDYSIIQLETTDESLIGGRSNKVIKKNGNIYVQSINDIVVFDDKGRFRNRLSKVGAGPDEYSRLLDFDIVTERGEIWVSSLKGIYRYDATTLEFNGLIPLSFFANKIRYISGDMFLTMTPGDKVFNLCDSKGAVLQSFMDQDLANSGLKTVQFVAIDGGIVSPVADTNSAVCYDVVNDEFSIRDIVSPEYDELVTMGINQLYFEQYGEMEYSDKIMDNFVGIGSFVNIGDFTILSLRYPGIKNAIAISTDSGTKEYIIWPESENVIEDDIFGKHDVSFLLTFGNCESNDSFLFFVENDDPDLNPSILEVKTLK